MRRANWLTYGNTSELCRNSQLLDLLENAFADIENHYMSLVEQQGRAYQKGWVSQYKLVISSNMYDLPQISKVD